MGLLKGLANLFIFSMKGRTINPRVRDLSIGKHAPIPRYIVKTVPNKNKDIATGLLKGLANLLIFSMKGRIISPKGINVCRAIPSNLFGTTRKI